MLDLMVDIESLSLDPRAKVLTIGVVFFDRAEDIGVFEHEELYHLSLDDQLDRIESPETRAWWESEPSQQAYAEAFRGQGLPVSFALGALTGQILRTKPSRIWARGPQFDLVVLRSLFADHSLPVPWSHKQERDSRTIEHEFADMIGTPTFVNACEHSALQDAIYEAKMIQQAYQRGVFTRE